MRIHMIIPIAAIVLSCNQSTPKQMPGAGNNDTLDTREASEMPPAKPDTDSINSDRLIIPGKRIGHLTIGMDAAQAIAMLKTPDASDAAMGSSLMIWYARHNPKGYQTAIFCSRAMGTDEEERSRIKKIMITSPWFRTTEGMGVGAHQAAIRTAFDIRRTQAETVDGREIVIYTDRSRGISFELDTVRDACIGIIVHAAGEDAGTYLNMRQ